MSEPVKRPGWAIGVHQGRVVIADGDKPIAAFSAPQAAVLAALLIRHACTIASGMKDVDAAIESLYGGDVRPLQPNSNS